MVDETQLLRQSRTRVSLLHLPRSSEIQKLSRSKDCPGGRNLATSHRGSAQKDPHLRGHPEHPGAKQNQPKTVAGRPESHGRQRRGSLERPVSERTAENRANACRTLDNVANVVLYESHVDIEINLQGFNRLLLEFSESV